MLLRQHVCFLAWFLAVYLAPYAFCEGEQFSFNEFRSGIVHVGQSETVEQGNQVSWFGTGFLVDGRCTFVTAKHIFRNANRDHVVVRFQLPQNKNRIRTLPAKIIFEDPGNDLAFLRIDRFNNQLCGSSKLHTFKFLSTNGSQNLIGEEVLIIGYPRLTQTNENIDIPVIRKGILASTEINLNAQSMLLLDLPGVPGFSGSPVVLEKTGEVIGVVFGPGPTKREAAFEWATPISKENYHEALKSIEQNSSNPSRDE